MGCGLRAKAKLLWMLTGFTVAVLAGFSVDLLIPRAEAQERPGTSSAAVDTPASDEVLWAYQNAFRRAAQEALPVVVKIDVVDVIRRQVQPLQNPFSFFFGPRDQQQAEPVEQEFRRPGLGSGVIVRRSGDKVYVLTNEHVVGEADEITVSLHDGRQFPATKVGMDDRRDLALIVFETRDEVPIARLGDSDAVQVGDWIFAVGNPLGFESTVTSGIISAVGRRPAPGSRISGLTDFIQTDAAINQGNSGGALVNLAGEVVGINTWIASQSGGNVGLGFAIPINNAKRAIEEFINYGSVSDGWLGIRFGGALSADLSRSMGIGDRMGVLVGSVFDGSPARAGGLLPGDIIRQIDAEVIDDWNELVGIVANLEPGRTSTFRVWRNGRTLTMRVRIERRDEQQLVSLKPWPGFSVMPLTDDMRSSLGLRNEPGALVVAEVDGMGLAATAGIRVGDIIRRVGDAQVATMAEFYQALNGQSDREIAFRLARQGREFSIGLVR